MSDHPHILLAGCGKMGTALVRGWQKKFPTLDLTIIEPNDIPAFPNSTHLKSADDLPHGFDPTIVVLAVKPQIMREACDVLNLKLAPGVPILSIAAGKSLAQYATIFGLNRPVIRAMPNTPAAIGHGISVMCANAEITPIHRHLATDLLGAVGVVSWIDDESLMDAVTAVSGSGPAYVFLLIEELANAGEKAGLPAELAKTLARQTVIGSAHLAAAEIGIAPATLRENVTSPGGTTEAALKVLMSENGLSKVLTDAVTAATKRGKELAR